FGVREAVTVVAIDRLTPHAVGLVAARGLVSPDFDDEEAEAVERPTVGRHRMVVEVAGDDLPQPFTLFENWLMHAPSQLPLHGFQLCPHAIAARLAPDLELASSGSAADKGEAEEVEGLRLAEPPPPAVVHREASELDQPGLLRMQ